MTSKSVGLCKSLELRDLQPTILGSAVMGSRRQFCGFLGPIATLLCEFPVRFDGSSSVLQMQIRSFRLRKGWETEG